MTLAGSLSALLSSEWSLTGNLASGKLRFADGWYDSNYARPQVTVSDLSSPLGRFFGTVNATLHHRFVVNVWLQIPRGSPGSTEKTQIEDMRKETFRIVNANRHDITSLANIVPLDEGTPHHEIDKTPRILRYEITVFGWENKP